MAWSVLKISKSFLSCWLRIPRKNGSRKKAHILLKQNDVLVLENLRNRTLNDMAHKWYKCTEFIPFFPKGFLKRE